MYNEKGFRDAVPCSPPLSKSEYQPIQPGLEQVCASIEAVKCRLGDVLIRMSNPPGAPVGQPVNQPRLMPSLTEMPSHLMNEVIEIHGYLDKLTSKVFGS